MKHLILFPLLLLFISCRKGDRQADNNSTDTVQADTMPTLDPEIPENAPILVPDTSSDMPVVEP